MPSKMLNKGILLQLFGGANKNIANGGGGGAGPRFSISFFLGGWTTAPLEESKYASGKGSSA